MSHIQTRGAMPQCRMEDDAAPSAAGAAARRPGAWVTGCTRWLARVEAPAAGRCTSPGAPGFRGRPGASAPPGSAVPGTSRACLPSLPVRPPWLRSQARKVGGAGSVAALFRHEPGQYECGQREPRLPAGRRRPAGLPGPRSSQIPSSEHDLRPLSTQNVGVQRPRLPWRALSPESGWTTRELHCNAHQRAGSSRHPAGGVGSAGGAAPAARGAGGGGPGAGGPGRDAAHRGACRTADRRAAARRRAPAQPSYTAPAGQAPTPWLAALAHLRPAGRQPQPHWRGQACLRGGARLDRGRPHSRGDHAPAALVSRRAGGTQRGLGGWLACQP